MKAALFDYAQPQDLAQALALLGTHAGSAKLMGGSQSLGPMLNLRLARPRFVVDISSIDKLRTVTEHASWVRIGAAVTHAEIEDGVHALLRDTPLQTVAGGIAYRAVRNRGTIGGSLAHADPAADWLVVAVAFGADIEMTSAAGTRIVAADAFMLGAYTTVLAEDEVISAVLFPAASASMRWGYSKLCRKTGEFAEASCAAYFDAAHGVARIAIGALSGAPQVLAEFAATIAGRGAPAATSDSIAAALALAMPDHDIVDRQLHAVAVERCLTQIFGAPDTPWR